MVDYHTKTELETYLKGKGVLKADGTLHDIPNPDLTNYYTKAEVDAAIPAEANLTQINADIATLQQSFSDMNTAFTSLTALV